MNLIQAIKLWNVVSPLTDSLKGVTLTNWKTTAAAIFAAIPLIAKYLGHPMDADLAAAISTIAVTFGFAMAKDHNVTGGTKQQGGG